MPYDRSILDKISNPTQGAFTQGMGLQQQGIQQSQERGLRDLQIQDASNKMAEWQSNAPVRDIERKAKQAKGKLEANQASYATLFQARNNDEFQANLRGVQGELDSSTFNALQQIDWDDEEARNKTQRTLMSDVPFEQRMYELQATAENAMQKAKATAKPDTALSGFEGKAITTAFDNRGIEPALAATGSTVVKSLDAQYRKDPTMQQYTAAEIQQVVGDLLGNPVLSKLYVKEEGGIPFIGVGADKSADAIRLKDTADVIMRSGYAINDLVALSEKRGMPFDSVIDQLRFHNANRAQ